MVTKHCGARRSAAKEAEWRKVIKEWRQSGETLAVFSEGRGLSHWTVRWWCTELKKRDAERGRVGRALAAAPAAAVEAQNGLVPVRVIDGGMLREKGPERRRPASSHGSEPSREWVGSRGPEGDGVIEIIPFGKVRIRIVPGFDPQTLEAILRVLERSC